VVFRFVLCEIFQNMKRNNTTVVATTINNNNNNNNELPTAFLPVPVVCILYSTLPVLETGLRESETKAERQSFRRYYILASSYALQNNNNNTSIV